MKSNLALILILLFLPLQTAWAQKANKLKFKVKQNTVYDDCAYSGEVVLLAKYKYKFDDQGGRFTENNTPENPVIAVLGSFETGVYERLHVHPISTGKGRANIVFDAGACLKDLQLTFATD